MFYTGDFGIANDIDVIINKKSYERTSDGFLIYGENVTDLRGQQSAVSLTQDDMQGVPYSFSFKKKDYMVDIITTSKLSLGDVYTDEESGLKFVGIVRLVVAYKTTSEDSCNQGKINKLEAAVQFESRKHDVNSSKKRKCRFSNRGCSSRSVRFLKF